MFAAVRERLGGAWRRLREGNLVRLFLFEFVVVLLGVLAAQWVADLAARRGAYAEMESERASFEEALARSGTIARGWKVVTPCLDDRMTLIMRAMADGSDLDPALLRRPALWGDFETSMSERSLRLYEKRYGKPRTEELTRTLGDMRNLNRRVESVILAWSPMALADASNGTPGPDDRIKVREAASEIKATLVGLNINADNIIDAARLLDVAPDAATPGQPVADCAELWRTGISHRIGNGRAPAYSRKDD